LIARWGPADKDGRRFAIVNCDRKWSPQDLILLSVAGDSVSQRSLLNSLDQSVQKFVAQQNKARRAPPAKDYTVEYPIFGVPEIGEHKVFPIQLLSGFRLKLYSKIGGGPRLTQAPCT